MTPLLIWQNNVSNKNGSLWKPNDRHQPEPENRVFLFNCGCSSTKLKTMKLLRELGFERIDAVKLTGSRVARDYVKRHNLAAKCPVLNKHTHSVLHNPETKECLNLMDGDYETIKRKAKGLINASKKEL